MTENNPGLGGVWSRMSTPVPRRGVRNRARGERQPLLSRGQGPASSQNNFPAAATVPSHSGWHSWNSPMVACPKRSVCHCGWTEAPAPDRGRATERRPSFSECALPELPATETCPCFSPELTPQGQSGSDRTGAAPTLPSAALILTPARPKQLSTSQRSSSK